MIKPNDSFSVLADLGAIFRSAFDILPNESFLFKINDIKIKSSTLYFGFLSKFGYTIEYWTPAGRRNKNADVD